MIQDLSNDNKLYIQNETGNFVELKHVELALPKQDESYTYCDVPFIDLSAERTFSFKMSKKSWYRVQKELGLVKAKFKKIRKGKRYVWYEII